MIRLELMRALDRWFGVPLLVGYSLWRRVRRRRTASLPPQRVLLIELAEMGSIVLAEPAMRRLREAGAELFFCTFGHNAEVLRLLPALPPERVFAVSAESLPALVRDCWRLRQWCRKRRIDTVVDLTLFSRLAALLAGWSGADRIAGLTAPEVPRGSLITHPVPFRPDRHMAQNALALAARLLDDSGLEEEPMPVPQPGGGQSDRAAVESCPAAIPIRTEEGRGQPRILVHATEGGLIPQRGWPRAHLCRLLHDLRREWPRAEILLIGGARDAEYARELACDTEAIGVRSLAGALTLEGLLQLYRQSDLLISSDSGPVHLAALAQLPVVALYGPETPVLFGPLGPATVLWTGLPCSPCLRVESGRCSRCMAPECMRGISPEQVLAAVRKALQLPGSVGRRVASATG